MAVWTWIISIDGGRAVTFYDRATALSVVAEAIFMGLSVQCERRRTKA